MDNAFNQKPIYGSTKIQTNRVYHAVASLDKNGFQVSGRKNSDAFYQIGKGGSVSILFSNYRSDCGVHYVNFEDFIPIFLDLQNRKSSYSEVVSSDFAINGVKSSVGYLVSGNSYCLRYPKNFGKIVFEKRNDQFYLDDLVDMGSYYETHIHPRSNKHFVFNILFENLPLASVKFNIFKPSRIDSEVITLKHYLNFYNFTLQNDRWLLDAPAKMTVEKNEKNKYSYFKSSGDRECFNINGYNSPILIFDYDKNYVIENKNKSDSPFYFDFYPEGMYKKPYSDFDNDINTDRLNLYFLFKGYGDVFKRSYENTEIDPYIETDFDRAISYDPDNIFYACSNKRYFGNKIHIGKKNISSIAGMYGMFAPESKKIIFDNPGSYLIYDYFDHVCGKIMNVEVIDYALKTINSQDDISSISFSSNELKFVDQKSGTVYMSLIGDLFKNVEEFAGYLTSGSLPSNLPTNGSIVIKINTAYFYNDKNNSSLFAYHYKKYIKNDSVIDDRHFYEKMMLDVDGYIKQIIHKLKSYRIFEVNVEFENTSLTNR